MSFASGNLDFIFLSAESDNQYLEFAKYNPAIPLRMKFPGVDFCGDFDQKLLIVGTISAESSEKPEIIFYGFDGEEAFHIFIDIENKFIDRWGFINGVETKREGVPGDGTTIGYDEPFVLV